MDADVIKQLVPFGIVGLGIVAVVVIAINPGSAANRIVGLIAMALIASLAIFDKLSPAPSLQAAPTRALLPTEGMHWVDTGASADWVGKDIAYTAGYTPKYLVKDMQLCDTIHGNSIAVCWDNRPSGFPTGTPTDVSDTPSQWCTYKDSSIRIFTAPTGGSPSRVYLCGHAIPH